MSKTFCPLPWIYQAVRNNGDIRLCCQANSSKSKGLLRKKDGSIFNASNDNLEESRNADLIKQTRLDMLSGKHPEPCIRCQSEESSGVRSRRNYENSMWEDTFNFKNAQRLTSEEGSIDTNEVPLIYYDIRLGNLCNLKCRMCGPTDSDSWYKDTVKVWGSTEFQDSHGKVKLVKKSNGGYRTENGDYDWIASESFWDQLKLNAPHIRHLHTVGGEPLLIEKQYELLETIIKYGSPKKVIIEYNTNLTVLPQRAIDLWKEFKNVRLGVSLDGYGEINDYIRYPSRFEKIEKNLDQIDAAEGNFHVWIATTVQAYNILHLPDFIKWNLKKEFKRVNKAYDLFFLTAHPLHNPKFLNVQILPSAYKKRVEKKFNEFSYWLEEWCSEKNLSGEKSEVLKNKANKLLSGYVNYMNSKDLSHLIPKFLEYTSKLDAIRNEKMKDVLPELYEDTRAWSDLHKEEVV